MAAAATATMNEPQQQQPTTHTPTNYKWPEHVASKMADFIHEEVKEMLGYSRLVRSSDGIALVNREELTLGKLMGKGAFSEVHEVDYKGNKYAMKHLKLRLMSQPENFRLAASELAVEAHMLASFSHPNILRIRGWAYNGISSFADGRHDSFFLLLDSLDETLDQRIAQWTKDRNANNPDAMNNNSGGNLLDGSNNHPPQQTHSVQQTHSLVTGIWKRLSNNANNNNNSNTTIPANLTEHERQVEQKRRNLMLEKMGICCEIASALCYLHEMGVIYRDLVS